jgi:2-C-methyl-D-erythritol 4-phosphate cytidylyltransferase
MRAAVPKVLLTLEQEGASQVHPAPSIVLRTALVFANDPECTSIIVCCPDGWRERFEHELSGVRAVRVIAGGGTRQDSVRLGVEYLNQSGIVREDTPVLVHDAARCCVTRELVQRVVEGVRQYSAVTAAVQVFDALCRVIGGSVEGSVNREGLWSVQTPQGFLFGDLRQAHLNAVEQGILALDDAALVAQIRPVRVVVGERLNIKVTEPADVGIARMIVSNREVAENSGPAKECA